MDRFNLKTNVEINGESYYISTVSFGYGNFETMVFPYAKDEESGEIFYSDSVYTKHSSNIEDAEKEHKLIIENLEKYIKRYRGEL